MSNVVEVVDLVPVLADMAARGLLLLLLAGLLTVALRRSSSAARHLVWTVALAGVLAVPVLRPLVPVLELRVLAAGEARESATTPTTPTTLPTLQFARATTPAAWRAPGEATVPGAYPEIDLSATTSTRQMPAAIAPSAIAPSAGNSSRRGPAPSMSALLVGVWLAGALLLLAPVVTGWVSLARLGRRLRQVDDPRIKIAATRLSQRLGVSRSWRLLEAPAGAMPMTFGLSCPAIVLPSDAAEWPTRRLEAVLLHELAHVSRRDTATQLLAEVVRALHWFDPLAWLAARRLRIEREHACDDAALAAGSRPSDYAEELLELVRCHGLAGSPPASAVAMARRGDVAGRLRAILDEGRRRQRVPRGRATAGAALGLVVVLGLTAAAPVPAAERIAGPEAAPESVPVSLEVASRDGLSAPDPAPAVSPRAEADPAAERFATASSLTCLAESGSWNQIEIQSGKSLKTITMQRRGCEFELRMEGEIDFDAHAMRIRRMSPGARLRMEESARGDDHSLDIRAGRDGAPIYTYQLNGRARPFEGEAATWFAAALESVFRTAGFMASERVEALLAQGGVEAVLRELGQLQTSHVIASYTEALLEQARLDEAQLRAVVRTSGRRVDSDHYLAGILEKVATYQALDGGLLDDYIAATLSLGSDHYRTQSLRAAIETGRLSAVQIERILGAAGRMGSDHARTQVLTGIADRYGLSMAFGLAYLEATAGMDSDHYRAEVLGRLLDGGALDTTIRADVLRAAGMLGSDHYRSELLKKVARAGLNDPSMQRAFFEVAADLGSDHYYRESIRPLLVRPLEADLLVEVLDISARQVGSDHYLSELLLEVLPNQRVEGQVREAFERAMTSIGSSHYRARVAEALLRAGGG